MRNYDTVEIIVHEGETCLHVRKGDEDHYIPLYLVRYVMKKNELEQELERLEDGRKFAESFELPIVS